MLIKTKILGPYHFRLERRLHLSPLQCCPVNVFEEWVSSDVPHNTQSASGISLKQLKK